MQNTGTTTWTNGVNGFTFNRSGTAEFGESSFYTTLNQSTVSTGNDGTYTLSLTAPTTPGTYTETWQMYSSVADGDAAFGATVTVQIVVPQTTTTSNSQLVSESVPVATQESAGASFTDTVTMQNTGTTTWTNGVNGFTFNRSGAAEFGESSFYTTLNQGSVSAGSDGTYTLSLTAPTTPGTYTETWQMYSSVADGDAAFGATVTVQILVPQTTTTSNSQLVSQSVPVGSQESGGVVHRHGHHAEQRHDDLDQRRQRLHVQPLRHRRVRRVELLYHAEPGLGQRRQRRHVHAQPDGPHVARHVHRDVADVLVRRRRRQAVRPVSDGADRGAAESAGDTNVVRLCGQHRRPGLTRRW